MLLPIQVQRKPEGKEVDLAPVWQMIQELQQGFIKMEEHIKTQEENTLYNRLIRWSKYG